MRNMKMSGLEGGMGLQRMSQAVQFIVTSYAAISYSATSTLLPLCWYCTEEQGAAGFQEFYLMSVPR